MPWSLKRFQQTGHLHFVTFSCYQRAALLSTPIAREVFVQTLERVRTWYGLFVAGYVVMPEHVHMLISEPERASLAIALQMLKQVSAQKLGAGNPGQPFWQRRYHDFNVWSDEKRIEKLRYLHRNPVVRGLAEKPEDWKWSSFRHYAFGEEEVVEIESEWTARKRERLGVSPQVRVIEVEEKPHPPALPEG